MESPKVFISYSWSNQSHEQWVIDLATELCESGIEAVLDKWLLKEGHDSVAFMEKMVNDKNISKVIIISDKIYAEKANLRAGGVGTETQIISKEIYENQEQEKFVAVVTQKDENGKPYLPTYYKSRIYIDLSESERYIENFEKLIRWIYNKPLHIKPQIGDPPSYITENHSISLGAASGFKRAYSAIKESKPFLSGAIEEYFGTISHNFERIRLKDIEGEFDDAVIKSIDEFIGSRNEIIQILSTVALYSASEENTSIIHRFFESIIPYLDKPKDVTSWKEWDFDNYRFIIYELFLYMVSIYIKAEKYQLIDSFLSDEYYMQSNSDYGKKPMVSYTIFNNSLRSFGYRNQRLDLRRLSLRADLIKNRVKGSGLEFRHIMQADFVLYIRSLILDIHWWPDTLVYASRYYGPFEVFARSSSKRYFDKFKCLLGTQDFQKLEDLVKLFSENKIQVPQWQGDRINPIELMGYENLCQKV